jgi:hypothetical protein
MKCTYKGNMVLVLKMWVGGGGVLIGRVMVAVTLRAN